MRHTQNARIPFNCLLESLKRDTVRYARPVSHLSHFVPDREASIWTSDYSPEGIVIASLGPVQYSEGGTILVLVQVTQALVGNSSYPTSYTLRYGALAQLCSCRSRRPFSFMVCVFREQRYSDAPRLLLLGIITGVPLGLLSDFALRGTYTYPLGYGLLYLILNSAVVYGLFVATVLLCNGFGSYVLLSGLL